MLLCVRRGLVWGSLALLLFPVQLDRSEILVQELMTWRNVPLSKKDGIVLRILYCLLKIAS